MTKIIDHFLRNRQVDEVIQGCSVLRCGGSSVSHVQFRSSGLSGLSVVDVSSRCATSVFCVGEKWLLLTSCDNSRISEKVNIHQDLNPDRQKELERSSCCLAKARVTTKNIN